MKITILGQPMAKQSFRMTKRGFKYTPKEVTECKANIQGQITNQLPDTYEPIQGEVVINELIFTFPLLKSFSNKKRELAINENIRKVSKPDIDNLQKNIYDACNHILWRDDSQITEVRLIKKVYGLVPGTKINFEERG